MDFDLDRPRPNSSTFLHESATDLMLNILDSLISGPVMLMSFHIEQSRNIHEQSGTMHDQYIGPSTKLWSALNGWKGH